MPTLPTFPGEREALADGWTDATDSTLLGVRILVRERLVVVLVQRAVLFDVVASIEGRVKVLILQPEEILEALRTLAAEVVA